MLPQIPLALKIIRKDNQTVISKKIAEASGMINSLRSKDLGDSDNYNFNLRIEVLFVSDVFRHFAALEAKLAVAYSDRHGRYFENKPIVAI